MFRNRPEKRWNDEGKGCCMAGGGWSHTRVDARDQRLTLYAGQLQPVRGRKKNEC